MNKSFEIACTILLCIFGYLLFNLYEELDRFQEKQRYYEKQLEYIYDYAFREQKDYSKSL